MGCDIHSYAERKINGVWTKVGEIFPDPYLDGQLTDEPCGGRNYDLFAILANVRNGYGFAGVDTGDGFVSIDQPRGLPDDVTPEVRAESDGWGRDGHSHSYFTLAELLAFDWDQVTKHRGVVSLGEYQTFKEEGSPQSWSGDVMGGGVVKVSNEDMDALLSHPDDPRNSDGKHYHTTVSWAESYRVSAGERWWEAVKLLQTLGDPDEVRIVFWFDN